MARFEFFLLALFAGAAVIANPIPDTATDDTDIADVEPLDGEEAPISSTIIQGPAMTAAPDVDLTRRVAPPNHLVITVVNHHGSAIRTAHARDMSGPAPVKGKVGPGVMSAGATASFAVPTGWAGNVALTDASNPITGDDTLIEASFKNWDQVGYAVVGYDVSYVNGYSLPVVCRCKGSAKSYGCNKNLFGLGTCGNPANGACINPLRSDSSATSAAPFFKPCQGAAYTFPHDDQANSYGFCQSGHLTCCVGAGCKKSSQQ